MGSAKTWISVEELKKHMDFIERLNKTPLDEVVWLDDKGKEVEIDPYLLKCWRFMGLSNSYFYELFVTRILAGEQDELRKELDGMLND